MPDLVLLGADAPQDRLPSPHDAHLVIEVAGWSVRLDRHFKRPLYARAGIPEYWIVDLNGGRIEVYRELSPDGYRPIRYVMRGESVTPAFAPEMAISVDGILGPIPEAED
jgi:Uma2 family endonuclease